MSYVISAKFPIDCVYPRVMLNRVQCKVSEPESRTRYIKTLAVFCDNERDSHEYTEILARWVYLLPFAMFLSFRAEER